MLVLPVHAACLTMLINTVKLGIRTVAIDPDAYRTSHFQESGTYRRRSHKITTQQSSYSSVINPHNPL